jgi:PAS domain S-box-containing protein
MPARGDDDHGLLQDKLLAELVWRQPLLAAINIATALLFAAGLLGAAPTSTLAVWLGYMALSQAARLVCWRYWRRAGVRRPPRKAAAWLVATSGMAGIGWGLIGLLFAGLGSAVQQLLVPFFLAGMAAGAVTVLSGHLPSFHAFLAPALLPYAARLELAGEPVAHTMALTTLAYAAGLSAVAHQVHRSLRRSVELHLENARLVADLEEARRGLERRAERRAAELETMMETVPAAIWLTHDPEARWIKTNRQAAEMLRLAPGDNASLTAPEGERPRHFRVFKGGEEVPGPALPLQRAVRGEVVRDEELRVVFDDGTFHDELISAAPVRNGTGKVIGAVGTAIDITERKRMEEALRQSEAKLRRAQDAAGIGDWELDLATGEIAWSERLCRLLRLDPGRIAPSRTALFELIHPEDRERFAAEVERAIAGDGALDAEFRVVMPDGAVRWLASRGELVRDGNGRPNRLAGVSFDVTEHKAAEERIRELALQDPLTGLPNRTLLQDRLRQMLTLARRGDGQVGLLLLDLDDFKDVNDTLGHPAGDRLAPPLGGAPCRGRPRQRHAGPPRRGRVRRRPARPGGTLRCRHAGAEADRRARGTLHARRAGSARLGRHRHRGLPRRR